MHNIKTERFRKLITFHRLKSKNRRSDESWHHSIIEKHSHINKGLGGMFPEEPWQEPSALAGRRESPGRKCLSPAWCERRQSRPRLHRKRCLHAAGSILWLVFLHPAVFVSEYITVRVLNGDSWFLFFLCFDATCVPGHEVPPYMSCFKTTVRRCNLDTAALHSTMVCASLFQQAVDFK